MACSSMFEEVNPGQNRPPEKMAVHIFLRTARSASDDIKDLLESKQLLFLKVSLQQGCVRICCRHCLVKYRFAQAEAILSTRLCHWIVTARGETLPCIQSCKIS